MLPHIQYMCVCTCGEPGQTQTLHSSTMEDLIDVGRALLPTSSLILASICIPQSTGDRLELRTALKNLWEGCVWCDQPSRPLTEHKQQHQRIWGNRSWLKQDRVQLQFSEVHMETARHWGEGWDREIMMDVVVIQIPHNVVKSATKTFPASERITFFFNSTQRLLVSVLGESERDRFLMSAVMSSSADVSCLCLT